MIQRLVTELQSTSEEAQRLLALPRGRHPDAVAIASRWEGRLVWAVFGRHGRWPALYVKVDCNRGCMPRLEREHRALEALRSRPELRATVPEPLALFRSGPRLVQAQTAVSGVSLTIRARQRVRHTPRCCAREHRLVFTWLARFQDDGTAGGSARLEPQLVMERAESALPNGPSAFLRHLEAMAERWNGLEVPLRCVHGDLSPSNCLIYGNRARVIDWDGAATQRSPLPELVFFLYHYIRLQPDHTHKQRTELPAFRLAFLGGEWLADLTARSYERQLRRLGLPVEAGEYLFAVTLVELATGEVPATYAATAVRYWKPLLQEYAAHHRDLRIRQGVSTDARADGLAGGSHRLRRRPRRPR
jgi:hypothetical protein